MTKRKPAAPDEWAPEAAEEARAAFERLRLLEDSALASRIFREELERTLDESLANDPPGPDEPVQRDAPSSDDLSSPRRA